MDFRPLKNPPPTPPTKSVTNSGSTVAVDSASIEKPTPLLELQSFQPDISTPEPSSNLVSNLETSSLLVDDEIERLEKDIERESYYGVDKFGDRETLIDNAEYYCSDDDGSRVERGEVRRWSSDDGGTRR